MNHSPVALLLAQITTILVVSRVVGVIFRRIGQPLVVAEIVAGIALGPSLLGAVWPEALSTLFPPSSLATLSGVSQLGLTLFMFIVGLEFDIGLLRSRARMAVIVAPASIALPFVGGILLAFYLHPIMAPPGISLTGFALFCGASMAVTAFPVLARILVETGLNKSPLGALTLTCAAFNDVVAWCLLAFVIAVVRSGGLLDAWTTTAATLGFIGIMYGVLRPFLARIAERYGTSRHISQSALALILVLVLCCALFSEAIGVHALFGAFLCGVIIPRQGHLIHNLREKLDDLVGVLLLPLFFASTGLKTQIGLLDTPELWGIGAIVLAVATAGKLLGSALPARWGGLSWRESFALGVMMNTRGLMELIILNIGLELGVLSPVLFAILVLVAVFSTLITTPILTFLFPTHTFVAQQTGPHPPTLPALSLLTCLSHPEAVAGLSRLSSQLCRSSDARAYALRLVPVQEDSSLFPSEPLTEEEDVASAAVRLSQGHGVQMQPISFPSANPARDICTVSRLKKADLILMGAHRSLLGRGPLAGLVQEVAVNADCDVAIFLEMGFEGARRVLVAQDGADTPAIKRILSWLSHTPNIQITPLDIASGNADGLIEAAHGYDLVIIGFRSHWMQALSGFDISKGRRVREMPCSLLVVHGN